MKKNSNRTITPDYNICFMPNSLVDGCWWHILYLLQDAYLEDLFDLVWPQCLDFRRVGHVEGEGSEKVQQKRSIALILHLKAICSGQGQTSAGEIHLLKHHDM